jgi:predicted DNA-binding transcriptional regulator YafY
VVVIVCVSLVRSGKESLCFPSYGLSLLTALCQQSGSRLSIMRRTERLFSIIQVLRSKRRPVTGRELAEELEVSLRTLYRDMAELLAQRVPIRGEAGTGYIIDSAYDMPPLMLTHDELEAAVLGAAWVAQRGDPSLARGARDLVAKLTAAVPAHLRPVLLDVSLQPLSFRPREPDTLNVADVRTAIRSRNKLEICYADGAGRETTRVIWPFLIAYMEDVRIIAAWCELRTGFRHFRTDRVRQATVMAEHFQERSAVLRKRWQAEQLCNAQRREQRS